MLKITASIARRIYERWKPDFRWGYQCCPGEVVYKAEFKMLLLDDSKRLRFPIIHKRITP